MGLKPNTLEQTWLSFDDFSKIVGIIEKYKSIECLCVYFYKKKSLYFNQVLTCVMGLKTKILRTVLFFC